MRMQVIVISLPVAQERRRFQARQLDELGLEYELSDAVGWQDVDAARGTLAADQWERVLMPTELACFLSHYQAWQKIAEGDRPILVLEDDVLLSSRIPKFLGCAENLKNIDHISLETRLRYKLLGQQVKIDSEFELARLYQDRTGAAAYILWPRGAAHLLQRAKVCGAALADAFIANDYGLMSYQSIPALAIQSDIAHFYNIVNPLQTESYIQARGRRESYTANGLLQWQMKWRRFSAQLRMAGRWVSTFRNSRRQILRPLPIDFSAKK